MKNLLFGLLLSVYALNAQNGVQFANEQPFENLFEKAKQSGKPVFLEIYSPTCHVCESFIPVFNSVEVGSAINPIFISKKIDVNSEEFKRLEKKYNIFVPSLPLMLFFNPNGSFMHHGILGMGQGAETVLSVVNTALDPKRRSSIYASEFNKGNREENFLVEYGMLTRIQKDTLRNISVANALFSTFDKAKLGDKFSYLILYKLVLDVDNGFFKYWVDHVAQATPHAETPPKDVLENIIFSSLYSNRGQKYSSAKIESIKPYLVKLGRSQADANRVTLLPLIKAWLKEKKTQTAINAVNEYTSKNQTTCGELTYLSKLFNDYATDASFAGPAMKWLVEASAKNKGHKELAEVHFESARIHQKSGNKIAAKKAAKMAWAEAIRAAKNQDKFKALYNSL